MISLDKDLFKKIAKEVVNIVEKYLIEFGYKPERLNKGGIKVTLEGVSNKKTVATSSHLDTLGLMVRSITSKGTLKLVEVGGPVTPTLDGEYCKVYTRDGRVYTGTVLINSPAVHVYPDSKTKERVIENFEVRLDEEVKNKEDVLKLGIQNGDFVCYDPKFQITEKGFLKSRFIDDKCHAVVLLCLLKYMKENNIVPKFRTKVYFVAYEEVGHGASAIDSDISEFVTLDMGCVGLDLDGNEYNVSICAKDAFSPYDYGLTNHLMNLAKEYKIPYVMDIYPRYSSDVSASLRAGHDIKGALIGAGTHASHAMERTHMKGIEASLQLIYLYLVK